MQDQPLETLKYPIGRFDYDRDVPFAEVSRHMETIVELPGKLAELVHGLSDSQLDTPYRPDGWTARQVVHHLADSHGNALSRYKLALTEDNPTIRPYHEDLWAELADGKTAPVTVSLQLLAALHQRWAVLLDSMREADFGRTYFHPQSQRTFALRQVTALYAWHGNHHFAHIQSLSDRSGW